MRTRLFKSFLVLSLLILGIGNIWGFDTHYYAQLQTKVASNSTGGGLVYASTTSSEPASNAYVVDKTSDKQDATNNLFVYRLVYR